MVLAAITFLGSLAVSGVLVASGIGLEWLVGFLVDKDTQAFRGIEFAFDVTLVGSATVVSACGALIVAGEAITSVKAFWSRTKE